MTKVHRPPSHGGRVPEEWEFTGEPVPMEQDYGHRWRDLVLDRPARAEDRPGDAPGEPIKGNVKEG